MLTLFPIFFLLIFVIPLFLLFSAELVLVENVLTGELSSAIGDYVQLQNLNLGSNQLNGSIPPEIGRLAELRHFLFPDCGLTGAIPAELGTLAKLGEILDSVVVPFAGC